jgi:hypothetical protein
MAGEKNTVFDCPMCINNIALKLGVTKALLLKIQSTRDGSVKVNGHSYPIGKLVPCFDDSDGFVLGYSGMASCGHMVSFRQKHLLIPTDFNRC